MSESQPAPEQNGESVIDSLTSLVLGMVLAGRDALAGTLRELEAESSVVPPVNSASSSGSTLGNALVGALFESQRVAASSARGVVKVGSAGLQLTKSVGDATGATRVGASAWEAFHPIVDPFEHRWARLVEIGRERETRARSLADSAFRSMTDVSIKEVTARAVEEVARSSETREVIRAETVSAAEAAAEEVRELAKEADSLLEGIVRSIFRRPPRRPSPLPADGPP